MSFKHLCAIAVLLVACKGKEAKPGETPAKDRPAVATADAGAAKKPATTAPGPKKSKLTAEQRRSYRTHLSAGRRLGGDKKWGEAVPEFQAALEVIPDDPRASAELGWAAFQAGDYVTAKKANSLASRASGDKKVRASALYNLGRVAEATGDPRAAAKYYTDSLALRPNKTVEARLAGLGTPLVSHGDIEEELPCENPMADAQAVCDCLVKVPVDYAEPDPENPAGCEIEDVEGPDDVAIARVDIDWGNAEFYLLYKGAKGWATISDLGYLYKGGMMGVSGEWEISPITEETKAGHRIVRITTVETHTDSDMGIDEVEELDTTTLTVCVLGDAPACPLSVPLHITYDRDRLGVMEESEMDAEVKAMMTPGLPIHSELVLDVDLAKDGTATVVLKKGAADESIKPLLGPHELWP